VVKREARRALHVKVAAVAERAMRADDDELAAAGELDRCELLLVVLFERRAELPEETRRVGRQVLDICGRGEESDGRLSLFRWKDFCSRVNGGSEDNGRFMPAITSASWAVRCKLVGAVVATEEYRPLQEGRPRRTTRRSLLWTTWRGLAGGYSQIKKKNCVAE
jgi:hypothetical protein